MMPLASSAPTANTGIHPAGELAGMDWTLNFDGTRDSTGRVVKGAVDDFFSGAYARSPLKHCPRQVSVTYREGCVGRTLLG